MRKVKIEMRLKLLKKYFLRKKLKKSISSGNIDSFCVRKNELQKLIFPSTNLFFRNKIRDSYVK